MSSPAYVHLPKIRFSSVSAARTAASGVISSRAALANIVGRTKVLNG